MAAADLVDVPTACSSRGRVSVVGVVVDTMDVWRTNGSSSVITFTIKDSEFHGPIWQGGLKVKYFNDNESFLPGVRVYDIVVLRNIRVSIYQGKPTGVASQRDTVPWAIFRPEPDPSSTPSITSGPVPFQLTPLEKRQALALLDVVSADERFMSPPPARRAPVPQQPSFGVRASAGAPKSGGLPFTLIKDAQEGRLAKLLGQVVKINTWDSEKCLLYITDYTKNQYLPNYKKQGDEDDEGPDGDQFNYLSRRKKDWPGPWGQMTLQVVLWEPHASFAREHVQKGDLVLLTYVHIKVSPSGEGLQASVHQDKLYPEKIHLQVVSGDYDDRAQQLLDRRKEYWRVHGNPRTDTKKAEKRKRKDERKKQEIRKEEGQTVLPATARMTLNPHIESWKFQAPVRSIECILSGETHMNTLRDGITYRLPFQNVRYRSAVRVVDFFPPNLEDFAVPVPIDSISDDGDKEISSTAPNQHTTWEWRFCLLVEGIESTASKPQPRERMKLFVSGTEGDHLLKLDATDLRRNTTRLGELQEALFILWGDLEERKRSAAAHNQVWRPLQSSSRPFICCIKEYGVRCTHSADSDAMVVDSELCSRPDCFGWERRFAMFGTTIHS